MRLSFFLFLIVLWNSSLSQNGALTAEIVNAVSPSTAGTGVFEFEPNIFYNHITPSDELEDDGDDSIGELDIAYRMSYSFSENIEMACWIPRDISDTYLAAKLRLYDTDRFALSTFVGTQWHLDSRSQNKGLDPGIMSSSGLGIAMSYDISSVTKLDFSSEYRFIRLIEDLDRLFVFADIGHYVGEDLMLFNSFGLQWNPSRQDYVWSLFPGIVIESDNFAFSPNVQIDVLAKGIDEVVGFNLAFTLIFEQE